MTKLWRRVALLLGVGALLFFSACPYRPYLYRTPRVVVDTVRVGRCLGRQWTYFCRYSYGHLKVRKIRCRRYGRYYTRTRRWIVRDSRCHRHAFIGSHNGDGPPPDDGP